VNDDNELSEVRESLLAEGASLPGVHMERPAETVMARGQVLRLRRRLLRGLSGVTAAGAAMALALALPLGGAGVRQVHVTETDWSVNTGQNGTVIVQLRKVSDPLRLEAVLAQAGVPAAVGWGTSCRAPGWDVVPVQVIQWHIVTPLSRPAHARSFQKFVYTIRPAAIPAHTRIAVIPWSLPRLASRAHHSSPVVWRLMPASAHLNCTGNPSRAVIWNTQGACGYSSPSPSPYSSPSPSKYFSPSPSPSSSPSPSRHSSPSPSPYSSPPASPYPSSSPSPHPSCTPSPHGTPSPSPHATPSPWITR
jgi:hypothetical protein